LHVLRFFLLSLRSLFHSFFNGPEGSSESSIAIQYQAPVKRASATITCSELQQ
jgi:hypothetical protein